MKPFLLQAPCKDYLWGGNRLREFGKVSDADKIAESWELSCHPDGESVIASGEFAGMTLTQFLAAHPEAAGENCRQFERFPVLIKLIDAHDDLSVQVHPDDAYALSHEGEYGKTEMWYVIDAKEGAELIYGFRSELTKDDFRRAIEENTLLDKVNRVPVRAGDVFFIPSGTLHAIGRGLLIAEVQQNSNTTYRVYDYGRLGKDGKPRELHIEKALDVTNLCPVERQPLSGPARIDGWRVQHLGDCRYFYVSLWEPEAAAPAVWKFGGDTASFLHLLVLDGSGVLQMADGGSLRLEKGASLFIPAGSQPGEITGHLRFLATDICQSL